MQERDFDVIVIGAGGAGLGAAVSAAEHGARVLILEADRKFGGSTAYSTGVVYAAGTSVQRRGNIIDTADAMFEYIMTLNAYRTSPLFARILSDRSADAIEWLISHGVEFRSEDLYVSGVESVARGHRAAGNGIEIVDTLDQAAHKLRVEHALNTRVQKLHLIDGAVSGVEVDGEAVTAAAVILATGGFGANPDLVKRYYRNANAEYWYPGTPFAQGDGLQLGSDAGADLAGPDDGHAGLTVGLMRELESYLPGWVIFVNRNGRRFVKETAAYAVMPSVLDSQPGNDAFVIFDEAARAAAKVIVTYKALAPSWTADTLQLLANQGRLAKFETLEEIASYAHLPAATFKNTISAYNKDCHADLDSQFFKDARYLKPVSTPPFYVARLRPGVLGISEKGLRVDGQARVLDSTDGPIPGLFAAGETAATLPGIYPGGGASLLNNTVFGRIAGREAAFCAAAGAR
jgi:fumarate reductase flavoprotein subunit